MLNSYTMEDGRIRHYSDAGLAIRQVETGNVYADAVDVAPVRYTYEETDIPLETPVRPEATPADYESALRELGVNV